mmetsp:Transcript_27239/g.75124  ORF Transcript_27239/g.75124 Transcript_27239/m.75124 type:complete len:388 (+) Transcript_27239:222-1385(+)
MSLSTTTTLLTCSLSKRNRYAIIGQPNPSTPGQQPEESDDDDGEGVIVWDSDIDDVSLQSLEHNDTKPPSSALFLPSCEDLVWKDNDTTTTDSNDEAQSTIRLPHLRQKSSSLGSYFDNLQEHEQEEENDEMNNDSDDNASNLRRPHLRQRQSSLASYQEEEGEDEGGEDIFDNEEDDDDNNDDNQSSERCQHFRHKQSSIASLDGEEEEEENETDRALSVSTTSDEAASETATEPATNETASNVRALHYREKLSTIESACASSSDSTTATDFEKEGSSSSCAWFSLCCIVIFFSTSSLLSGSMAALTGSVVPMELATILTALIVLSAAPYFLEPGSSSSNNMTDAKSPQGPLQVLLFLTAISFLLVWCTLFVYYGAATTITEVVDR